MPRNSVVCCVNLTMKHCIAFLSLTSQFFVSRLKRKELMETLPRCWKTGERPLRSMTYFKPFRLRSFVSNITIIRRSSSKQLHVTLAISSTNVWYIRIAEINIGNILCWRQVNLKFICEMLTLEMLVSHRLLYIYNALYM